MKNASTRLRALLAAALVLFCARTLLCTGASASAPGDTTDGTAFETSITFADETVRIDGTGVSVDSDGDVKIEQGGIYRISGKTDDGRVVISADGEEIVLILDGADIRCPDDEAIYVKAAGSAEVRLAAGSGNTLISGDAPAEELPEDGDEDASGAALRAKCPMTITGEGQLTVLGYINNGIASSQELVIESGTIAVTAVNDGVKSKTDLTVRGGTLDIAAAMDGIQAEGALTLEGGDITVLTGAGSAGADMKISDSLMMGQPGGRRNGQTASNEARSSVGEENGEADGDMTVSAEMDDLGDAYDADSDSGSHKGLKAGALITIRDGCIALDCQDDAVHSDGDVAISGGSLRILSGDDGVHGDQSLTISGGTLELLHCYEGLEARDILIEDGTVDIVARDDGMNVNGGSFGGPSREASGEDTKLPVLRIRGGIVLVDSGGDGLDSNGSIYIEGGEVYVSGPSTNWDAAIDYGEGSSEFIVTGGTVMAAGYSGMAEAPDSSDDAQGFIYYVSDTYCADGDLVRLTDARGNVIAERSFSHSFNCVVISSPLLQENGSYILTMGGTEIPIELNGSSYSNRGRGGFGGPGMPSGDPSRAPSGEAADEGENTD